MLRRDTISFAAGLVCIAAGVFFAIAWNPIIDFFMHKGMVLSRTSKTYEPFMRTNIPIYMKFYFWNWTNPSDMKNPNYRPEFTEMGPYVYREVTEKTNVVWNNNGTVSFRKKRYWYLDEELTNGSIDDMVTTINVVSMTAAYISRFDSPFSRMGLNVALSATQEMHVRKPVRELLFEGYSDALLDTAVTLSIFAKIDIPFDKFGWFYQRNGSDEFDGLFNIETGENGMDVFGTAKFWNYMNKTDYFRGECNNIRGSSGDFFPPKLTKNDKLEVYAPDLCRYMTFQYTKDEELYGIDLLRYDLKSTLYDNGAKDEANACFCESDCPLPGALNVSACRFGAPAMASYPHFLHANHSYRDALVGMNPDPEKHGGYMFIEPTFSIPFEAFVRIQINIMVEPFSDLTMYNGVKRTIFPVIWFENSAKIPEEMVQPIYLILMLPCIGRLLAIVCLLLGGGLTMGVIYIRSRYSRPTTLSKGENGKATEPMLNPTKIREGIYKAPH